MQAPSTNHRPISTCLYWELSFAGRQIKHSELWSRSLPSSCEWSGGCIVAALEASGQTNPSESVERGRQAFLAKAFSQYPCPPLDLILFLFQCFVTFDNHNSNHNSNNLIWISSNYQIVSKYHELCRVILGTSARNIWHKRSLTTWKTVLSPKKLRWKSHELVIWAFFSGPL